jgi:hypothetical protein
VVVIVEVETILEVECVYCAVGAESLNIMKAIPFLNIEWNCDLTVSLNGCNAYKSASMEWTSVSIVLPFGIVKFYCWHGNRPCGPASLCMNAMTGRPEGVTTRTEFGSCGHILPSLTLLPYSAEHSSLQCLQSWQMSYFGNYWSLLFCYIIQACTWIARKVYTPGTTSRGFYPTQLELTMDLMFGNRFMF